MTTLEQDFPFYVQQTGRFSHNLQSSLDAICRRATNCEVECEISSEWD